MRKTILVILLMGSNALAEPPLTMDKYLEQVRTSYQGYKGSKDNRAAAEDKSAQADLITAFKIEGSYQNTKDEKLSSSPALTYDRMDLETYSLGVAKTTSFGLDAKLSYDIDQVKYISPSSTIPGGNPLSSSTPTLTLTQSLFQNGFGSKTRAQVDASRAQAIAERENSEANLDSIIQKASVAYWNLVFYREVLSIQKAALEQSEAIYKYNSKRSGMNLTDKADALQSKANFESKKLDLQSAIDNEEIYLRQFNLYRNAPPMENPGVLGPFDWSMISKFKIPESRKDRADVRAAKAQAEADAANYKVVAESYKPVLNVYGSYSLNGRASSYNDAISDSYSANRPTTTVGLTFSMPLDIGSLNKAKSAAKAQVGVSETNYQQKVLDQEASWIDLRARISAVQKRVELSESIVSAQFEKLKYERARLKEGRTSTYQVLLFEQDYINARLAQVQNGSELITLLSQIKLYDGIDEGGSK